MSNTEKDYGFAQRWSLDILRQMNEGKILTRPFASENKHKQSVLDFMDKQEGFDKCYEHFETVFIVLRKEELISRVYPHQWGISKNGKHLFKMSEDERKVEVNKIWQAYKEWEERTSTPITVEGYIKALQSISFEGGKKFAKARRFLAVLYGEQQSLLTFGEIATMAGDSRFQHQSVITPFRILGELLRKKFDCEYIAIGEIIAEIFLEFPAKTNHKDQWRCRLRPNFSEALKQFPIAKWGASTSKPVIEMPNMSEADEKIVNEIKQILDHKKQVILYGAPGTGKTYMANEYVKSIYNEADQKIYVYRCTFHPEYGYEHFIEGYRPSTNANKEMVFELKDGIFKKLCETAKDDKNNKYYLIIDEINRGDIPRIFGELITLIEKDKRKSEFSVFLPHSGEKDNPNENQNVQGKSDEEKKFYVPDNVYIIATMNTADRSIALLDTALRRRFGFLEMKPEYYHFEKIMIEGILKGKEGKQCNLATWFETLNTKLQEVLMKTRHDAEHILIGHSYFLIASASELAVKLDKARFEQIIQYEILPLLREYCYENKEAYGELVKHIKGTTHISSDVFPHEKSSVPPKVETEPVAAVTTAEGTDGT